MRPDMFAGPTGRQRRLLMVAESSRTDCAATGTAMRSAAETRRRREDMTGEGRGRGEPRDRWEPYKYEGPRKGVGGLCQPTRSDDRNPEIHLHREEIVLRSAERVERVGRPDGDRKS